MHAEVVSVQDGHFLFVAGGSRQRSSISVGSHHFLIIFMVYFMVYTSAAEYFGLVKLKGSQEACK